MKQFKNLFAFSLTALLVIGSVLFSGVLLQSQAVCGDNSSWSAWSEEKPQTGQGIEVQEKTGLYKYQTKETGQSSNASQPPAGNGWVSAGTKTVYGEYGKMSAWSPTVQTETDTKHVEAKEFFYYYHWCSGTGGGIAPSYNYDKLYNGLHGAGRYGEHSVYSESELPVFKMDKNTSGKTVYKGSKCEKNCPYYYYGGKKKQYRYQTRTKSTVYLFTRLTDPKLCAQDDITNGKEIAASETVVPVSVTLYRYRYTEHNYGAVIVLRRATCTQTGLQYQVCSRCGTRVERVIEKTDHNYRWVVDTKATCGSTGIQHEACSYCGLKRSLNTVIPATGKHSFSSTYTIDVEPTCVEEGTKSRHCLVCDARTDVTAVPVTSHRFSGEWMVERQPTCTEEGLGYQLCAVCGERGNEQSLPKSEHTYQTQKTAATVKKNGKTYGVCTACGQTVKYSTIRKIAVVKLSKPSFVFDGKKKTPELIVQDSKGKALRKNVDYKVKYPKARTQCGSYNVVVTFKDNYSGKTTLLFKIVPEKVTGLKQDAGKGVKFSWNAVDNATVYDVEYYDEKAGDFLPLPSKKYPDGYTVTQAKGSLKKGTKMKVRVRAVFITKSGERIAGKYSKTLNMVAK